jgi:hypothetical protein
MTSLLGANHRDILVLGLYLIQCLGTRQERHRFKLGDGVGNIDDLLLSNFE